jgi:RNA recognition motif-containing protein
MSKKLYVGGLSYATTDADLQTLFAEQGAVISAVIISDRDSGRSKGFGFVDMASSEEASSAIEQLNGKSFGGRNISVSEARERAPRKVANSGW